MAAMDNFYRPPAGDPGDHQPTEQFWPGQGTPPGSQGPGYGYPRPEPGLQAHTATNRSKAWHWAVGITLAGYLLGSTVPGIDQYLLPVIAIIVIASAVPVAIELLRARRHRKARPARHARTEPADRTRPAGLTPPGERTPPADRTSTADRTPPGDRTAAFPDNARRS